MAGFNFFNMRIGIDARSVVRPEIGRVSGINQYTSAIIAALVRLAPEEILLFGEEQVPERWRSVPFVGHHVALPRAIHEQKVDVFFSPTGLVPLGLTIPSIAFIHDIFIIRHPEWFPDSVTQQLFTLKLVLPRGMKRSARLLVPSERVRADVEKTFPESVGKISVVPEGVPQMRREDWPLTVALKERLGIRDHYLISVATIEPRKNLLTALKAFEGLLINQPALAREWQYVIAGNPGWMSAPVFAEMEALNGRWRHFAPEVVRYVGSVSEEEKWTLYANAELYVNTSLAEGFGLPPFEAMAVGTPVATTAVGAVPELAVGAVVLIPSDEVSEITFALRALINDPVKRQELGERGRKVAEGLTWEKAGEQTLVLLREAGNG